MTAFTFILGVFPLVIATGAGAAGRQCMGTAVFGGMIAATVLGVFMVPVFFVVVTQGSEGLKRIFRRKPKTIVPVDAEVVPVREQAR
jgi:HAE1 family hydrophobic/amphiphilic exporter-1